MSGIVHLRDGKSDTQTNNGPSPGLSIEILTKLSASALTKSDEDTHEPKEGTGGTNRGGIGPQIRGKKATDSSHNVNINEACGAKNMGINETDASQPGEVEKNMQ